jgi:large subunit ribosomal protein LP2
MHDKYFTVIITSAKIIINYFFFQMRYVAAYLLAVLGGNATPDAAAIKKILSSVEVNVDDAALNKVLEQLAGKNLDEVIAAGKEKLASVPSVGAASSSAPTASSSSSAPAKEEKKEEKPKSEDEAIGAFGLFDD